MEVEDEPGGVKDDTCSRRAKREDYKDSCLASIWHLDVALVTPYEFGWQKGGLEWHEACLLFL